MPRAYVGIGSNLGDSAGFVREAFARLLALGTDHVNSDLYLTQPWGGVEQAAFINAVAAFETALDAHALLRELHSIEAAFGRERARRFGPRTIDLDLLLFGDLRFSDGVLTVPHPRLHERAFALEPLAEIVPDVVASADGRTAGELVAALPASERSGVTRLQGTATLVTPRRVDYDAPGGAGEGYAALRPFSPFDKLVLAAAVDAIGDVQGARILDVGCGTGRFSEALRSLGARVTGCDRSEMMLAAARENAAGCVADAGGVAIAAPPVEYLVADANRGLPGDRYDAITAFYCVQYLDVAPFASRAHDALRDGGTIAIASFPHRHFADILYARYFPSLPAIDMGRFPSAQALEAALVRAGFQAIGSRDVLLDIFDDPASLIGRIERRFLSSFYLLPEAEFEQGLVRMRADWQGKASVRRMAQAMVVSGRAGRSGAR